MTSNDLLSWNHKHITVPHIPAHAARTFLNTGCSAGGRGLSGKTNKRHHLSTAPAAGAVPLAASHTETFVVNVQVLCNAALATIGITNPTLRAEVHNRITLKDGFADMDAYTSINPPVCTISLTHPALSTISTSSSVSADGDLVVEGLRIPVSIPPVLAPDAMISVQYLATKNPDDHILTADSQLLQADPGRDLLFGFVLFPLKDLLRGEIMRAEVYPVGHATTSQRIVYEKESDAICLLTGRLENASAVARAVSFQTASAEYLDIRTRVDDITRIVTANETEMVSQLYKIGASRSIPEAVMCWEHMMMTEKDSVVGSSSTPSADGIFLNGHYFNMLPHPASPLHFGSAVVVSLVHMALVSRHAKEPWLFLTLPDSILRKQDRDVLQTAPHRCSATTVFDLEYGRLMQMKSPLVHDILQDLAVMAGGCLIRHGTYCSDEALIIHKSATTKKDSTRKTSRPTVVASDYYAGWEKSDGGFNGDCEDIQAAIVMLLSYIEHDGDHVSDKHALLAAIVRAARNYLCLTAVGTARADRLGVASVANGDAGALTDSAPEGTVEGVRSGIQGHIHAMICPRSLLDGAPRPTDQETVSFNGVVQIHSLQAVGEGTTAQDSRNRPDPNPKPLRVLVDGLLQANSQALQLLGLTSKAIWTFAPVPPAVEFYDGICSTVGIHLHDVVDSSAQGGGRRVTAAALTMIDDDGERRVGVPTTTFLDPDLSRKRQVRLVPVGWESNENLERVASVNMMMPARIVPTPSDKPGIRTELADIPAHLHVLHRDSQPDSSPLAKRRAARGLGKTPPQFVIFGVRMDRTTAKWAEMMYTLVCKVEIVCSVDVYVENIFKGLRGVCVVVGLFADSL